MKKNIIPRLIIIFMWIVLPFVNSYSQNSPISIESPIVMPVTPEAAAMAKHVSYPINYSTGKIDITIPLYEIKVGDIILPITLSYDAAGFRPRYASGRIAKDWILNAEPSIMRYVKGIPDDAECGYLYSTFNAYNATNDYLRDIYKYQLHDEEPDEFHYQLASGGGTCYLGANDKTHMVPHPYNDDKIETNYLRDIRIFDSKGIRYEFGYGCREVAWGVGLGNTTRWLCESINSPSTCAKISFDYTECKRFSPSCYALNDFIVVNDEVDDGNSDIGVTMVENENGINNYYSIVGSQVSWTGTGYQYTPYNKFDSYKIIGQNLNHIYFDNGTITFTWDSPETIGKMEVRDKESNLIRTVHFYSSKYNKYTEHIKLDSLVISKDGTLERQVYKFEYDRVEYVPSLATKNIDHWGFYNSFDNKYEDSGNAVPFAEIYCKRSISSRDSTKITIGGRNRNSNGNIAQIGVLKMIKYPTGLMTFFTYEGNITRNITSWEPKSDPKQPYPPFELVGTGDWVTPVAVGGLRIKSITEYDPQIQLKKTKILTYKNLQDAIDYSQENQPDLGFGVVRKIVSPDDYLHIQSMTHTIICENTYLNTRSRTWGSMPLSNITYRDGVIIFYEHIIEEEFSTADTAKNITNYYYQAPYFSQDNWSFEKRNPYIPFEPLRQDDYNETSYLIKLEKYKNNTLLNSTDYRYAIKNANNRKYTIAIGKTYQTNISNNDICATQKDRYNRLQWYLNNSWKELETEIYREYFDSGKILETKKNYFYQTSQNYPVITNSKPLKIVSVNSNGKTIEDHYTYSTDIISSYPEKLGGSLLAFNMKSIPIEYKHIEGMDTAYTRSYYSGTSLYQIKTKNKPGPGFDTQLNFNKYNSYGNIADISTRTDTHTCYLWSYNNQQPIAKIENVTYEELLKALGKNEEWIDELGKKIKPDMNDFTLINGLRDKLPKSLITTYTYKPLIGVTSITDPRNITTYYEYDSFGRLSKTYIKENNVIKIIQKYTYKLTQ